jgi:hypothetical protein
MAVFSQGKRRCDKSSTPQRQGNCSSFIAAPGHISSHRGRASAPASYAWQFGVEAPNWPVGTGVIWCVSYFFFRRLQADAAAI